MKIDEVHFNHDQGSAAADALNIRWNQAGQPIVAPEWKDGQPPSPAAYARDALGSTVTIKARITGGPANATRKIRAVDPYLPPPDPGGCLGWLIALIAKILRAVFGNVLGEVQTTNVSFDASGDSGLVSFTLINHKLASAPVGIRTTTWMWQVKKGKWWIDIGTTEHRIFVVLDVPNEPWNQTPVAASNAQLPWVDALEKACMWALGAQDADQAAEKITKSINTRPNQEYSPVTVFGSVTYELSDYLYNLDNASSFILNCRDCANAVTTMANLLGCDLYEGKFNTMNTRPFLTLNGDPSNPADWVSWGWGWHEIAWLSSTMGPNELVYDGCLQLDVDNDYTDAVHIAQHVIKMQFGTTTDGSNYRYRLIETGTGTPDPPTRRRPVG